MIRTLVAEDPAKPHRTGITHLPAVIESHNPVDVIIIMLGTNDVKSTYNLSAEEIGKHLEQTIQLIQSDNKLYIKSSPKIVVVCPSPVCMPSDGNLDPRMVRGLEVSKELPAVYRRVAEQYGCAFIDAGEHIQASEVDGCHFSEEGHERLADIIVKIFK